jgi:hypothetical protein
MSVQFVQTQRAITSRLKQRNLPQFSDINTKMYPRNEDAQPSTSVHQTNSNNASIIDSDPERPFYRQNLKMYNSFRQPNSTKSKSKFRHLINNYLHLSSLLNSKFNFQISVLGRQKCYDGELHAPGEHHLSKRHKSEYHPAHIFRVGLNNDPTLFVQNSWANSR